MQADASVAPVLLKNVAAGHGKQAADESAASIELNVPDSHGTHCNDPGASAYVPLGHAAQLTELAGCDGLQIPGRTQNRRKHDAALYAGTG